MTKNKGAAERAVLTVRETADILGIGINLAYEAIRAGQIPRHSDQREADHRAPCGT